MTGPGVTGSEATVEGPLRVEREYRRVRLEFEDCVLDIELAPGDALAEPCDVLLLKYAQEPHGLDAEVIERLGRSVRGLERLLPPPGEVRVVPGGEGLAARRVLFAGTPPLPQFGPETIRSWAALALGGAAEHHRRAGEPPSPLPRFATTLQGQRIRVVGIDEREAVEAQLDGMVDALVAGRLTPGVTSVRIVERDVERLDRASGWFASWVPEQPVAPEELVDDRTVSRTVAAVLRELRDSAVSAAEIAAALQRVHPEYINSSFGSLSLREPAGARRRAPSVWVSRVQSLYDPAFFEQPGNVLDGRMLLAGLAMEDLGLRGVLTAAGALDPLLAELPVTPRDPNIREGVRFVVDDPARPREDRLNRKLLASAMADQLERVHASSEGCSFELLLDGRWGAGKTTLIGFLLDDLRARSIKPDAVVWFDAWQHSRSGPAWLRLMSTMRSELIRQRRLPWRARVTDRWRRLGRARQLTTALLAAAFLVVVALWLGDYEPLGDRARGALALLTGLGTVVTLASGASRVLAADSQRQARSYVDRSPEPMQEIAEDFQWLRSRCEKPIVLVIDDLDRCSAEYVVEVLDTIQKLVRPGHPADEEQPWLTRARRGRRRQRTAATLFVIVAADGRWLRTAYERAHHGQADVIGEPGRPLGAMFLDKLFQVHVPLPQLSVELQQTFLEAELGVPVQRRVSAPDERRERIEQASSHEEILREWADADPSTRAVLASVVQRRLSEGDTAEGRHALERFGPLLERNPRSIRRFLMAFGALRAARIADGTAVATEALALWTILYVRWPVLAGFLADDPGRVELFRRSPEEQALEVPEDLRDLFSHPPAELARVMNHVAGGPLTPAVIALCNGYGSGSAGPGPVTPRPA